MQARIWRRALAVGAALACAQQASAQVFVDSPGNLPQGPPWNNSLTEQIDFADIDLDGDWDCGLADGGDIGNDQNRIWVNLGGAQAGTIGFFADETATRAPVVGDASRDLEFVDFDADGDPDAYIANTASLVNQGGRWWTNQGGQQAGSAGFFLDETSTRWVGVGGAGSSVPPSAVLGEGNFITWAQDQDFADVDADGDLDLIAATVGSAFGGGEPTRIFLNDGQGFFSEFNPSGFQLPSVNITNGSPALWAEGLQQHGTNDATGVFADIAVVVQEVTVADIDGDLDVDILLVDRGSTPRMFQNRLSDTGSLVFRDATGITWPEGWGNSGGKYDAELADFDGDDDVDLYGLNWFSPFNDGSLTGAGDGTFVDPTLIAGTSADDDASDVVDYDADGDLDVYTAVFGGADRLVANTTTPFGLQFEVVPGAVSLAGQGIGLDADAADVDGDGDSDVMRGGHQANHLLLNVLNAPDTTAPRLANLEQPADHASGNETLIRVHVYDNVGPDQSAYDTHVLSYSVDNGPFVQAPMTPMGGQVYRGALPASAVGNVRYFATSTDENGNSGRSKIKSIDTSGGCSGQVSTYCVGKLNTDGCVPYIEFEGAPEYSATTSFDIFARDVLAGQTGLLFYTKDGAAEVPFNGGTICLGSGILRTAGQVSAGFGPCNGVFAFDFNFWIGSGIDPFLVPGQSVWAQYWYRDNLSLGGVGLTDAITFEICP